MDMKFAPESSWAVGGGIIAGIGFGFFFLPNALFFVGSLMTGLGIGLIIATVISKSRKD